MCEKCNSTSAECQRRYIVSCTFIDDSGQAWVSAFNESALELFGKVDADQLAVYKEVRSRRPVV
jgi:replication factor A1